MITVFNCDAIIAIVRFEYVELYVPVKKVLMKMLSLGARL